MKNNNYKNKLMAIASSASHKEVSNININLADDLNMDSLDIISFLFEVENELHVKIHEEDIDELELLNHNNLYRYISERNIN